MAPPDDLPTPTWTLEQITYFDTWLQTEVFMLGERAKRLPKSNEARPCDEERMDKLLRVLELMQLNMDRAKGIATVIRRMCQESQNPN